MPTRHTKLPPHHGAQRHHRSPAHRLPRPPPLGRNRPAHPQPRRRSRGCALPRNRGRQGIPATCRLAHRSRPDRRSPSRCRHHRAQRILRLQPTLICHPRTAQRLETLHPPGVRRIRPSTLPRPQTGTPQRPRHGNARDHRLPPTDHQSRDRSSPRCGMRWHDPKTPRPRPDPHRRSRGTSWPPTALRNDRPVFRTLRHPLDRRTPQCLRASQNQTARSHRSRGSSRAGNQLALSAIGSPAASAGNDEAPENT